MQDSFVRSQFVLVQTFKSSGFEQMSNLWKSSCTGHPPGVTNSLRTNAPIGNQSDQVVEIYGAVLVDITKAVFRRKTLEISTLASDHRPQSTGCRAAFNGGWNTDLTNTTGTKNRITFAKLTALVGNAVEITVLTGHVLKIASVSQTCSTKSRLEAPMLTKRTCGWMVCLSSTMLGSLSASASRSLRTASMSEP